MQASAFTGDGKKSGDVTLSKDFFGVDISGGLVHRLFKLQRGNARSPIAHTLTRGERRGSTRKIYRQKGTGNARMGSNRSPIRKKGGIVFGPRSDRNFETSMNKKERRKALLSLLTDKANEKKVAVLKDSKIAKTKDFAKMANGVHGDATALYAVTSDEKNLVLAGRNIPTIKVIYVNYLNPADIMKYDSLVFSEAALEGMKEIFKPLK